MLAVLLTLVMLFVSYIALPVRALAEEAEQEEIQEAIGEYAQANDFSQESTLPYSRLIGELPGERDESRKVFRREDGAQEAVLYSDPVNYRDGDAWRAIDNTLERVTFADGTQGYRNKGNDFIVSFADSFAADKLVTVESEGHILSWRFTEDVLFSQEEADETVTEEPTVAPTEEQEEIAEPIEPEVTEEQTVEPTEEPTAEPTPEEMIEPVEEEPVIEEEPTQETEVPEEPTEPEEIVEPNEAEEITEPTEETEEPTEEPTPEPTKEPTLEPTVEPTEEPTAEPTPFISTGYETLRITNAKATVIEQERTEPETDEERDMLLRFPKELTSEIAYTDPETGLNVRYMLSGKTLSEHITLEHAPQKAAAYTALLESEDLTADKSDGKIVFTDTAGETIFELGRPVMYDVAGAESTEIEVRLTETGGGYVYTLIPDETWLKDASRQYPITIDPDIHPSPENTGSVTDTYGLTVESSLM